MMIEPVALPDFFISFFSGALLILLAAAYAGLYAWAQLSRRAGLRYCAWLVYALLLACTWVFAQALHLQGHWRVLVALMAVGYWWMPRFIWQLCVASHPEETD